MRKKFAFIRICLIALVLFPFYQHAQSQAVPEIEYLALRDFFDAMNGPGWSATYRWNTTQNNVHEGGWHGVTVADGHVTAITLNFGAINGAVPASFGNLKYLKTLSINTSGNSCNWSTTDLNVFSGLDSLTSLTIRYSQLRGAIPASWSRLVKLQTLDLRNNSITGMAPEFGNLSNLATLTLNNNQIAGALPPEFGNLTNLIV
jgi:hypothetical protein